MTQVPVKSRSRARSVLLFLLLLIGFACTVGGVCLIAFSNSVGNVRIGFVVALWGALLGSWALHGTRWSSSSATPTETGGVLELRRSAEVEREDDTLTRREYELRLELMLRRQMESVLREQVTLLRQDVAGLRGEVLEAVDGRLRLERIETTRIIGSDLAALQNEVRRLNVDRDSFAAGVVSREGAPTRERNAPAAPAPSGNGRSELWTPSSAQAAPATPSAPPAPEPVEPVAVAPAPPVVPSAPPVVPSAPPVVPSAPAPPVEKAVDPTPAPAPEPFVAHFESDPFAGLPRLSSFDAEALTPTESKSAPKPTHQAQPPAPAGAPARPGGRDEYVGRRRSR